MDKLRHRSLGGAWIRGSGPRQGSPSATAKRRRDAPSLTRPWARKKLLTKRSMADSDGGQGASGSPPALALSSVPA